VSDTRRKVSDTARLKVSDTRRKVSDTARRKVSDTRRKVSDTRRKVLDPPVAKCLTPGARRLTRPVQGA
jgi:hypothetical protein